MTVTRVILADLSTLRVGGNLVESAQSFTASRASSSQAVYSYDSSLPNKIFAIPGVGQGSFSYVASDATHSNRDWQDTLNGTALVEIVGGLTQPGTAIQTLSFEKCAFGGQSVSMNARSEMIVTVNFFFGDGSTF